MFRRLLISTLVLCFSAAAFAQIGIGVSVRIGPPAIPVYAQPICPGPGYFWTPGYWAWDDVDGYYWVPGTWVIAPVGLLWTPGYWGWYGGFYRWHPGYWGPHVGFYGGINYGFGYTGVGFWGGEWRGERFFYNRSVVNVNVTRVTNVYERNVVVTNTSHVSFNGGEGGISARPTAEEERFEHEPHREALSAQTEHQRAASQNRQLFASRNHGRPAIAATGRPGEFKGHDVVAAKSAGGSYHAPKISPREARVSENEARSAERNNGNNREARSEKKNEDKSEANRSRAPQGSRNADRREARDGQRQERQQAKQEQKRQQQEQRRQQQQQKAQRKQQQQNEKRQRQEQKHAAHEGRGGGR